MAALADDVSRLLGEKHEAALASPLILVTMMVDDSTSMGFYDNFLAVMDGHNTVLTTLAASARAPVYLARTQYMHGRALASGYRPLPRAPRMTLRNYHLRGGTPLFVASRRVLWYVRRRAEDYTRQGNDVYTLTLLLTDGHNRNRRPVTAEQVAKVVRPMLETKRHIIAGVGVASPLVEFGPVFLAMGIPKEWIITLRSAAEIRATFGSFSGLIERSSTSGDAFAETQVGGFSMDSTKG